MICTAIYLYYPFEFIYTGSQLKRQPNHPASGNGAAASLFHIVGLGRAVPEPGRWATP